MYRCQILSGLFWTPGAALKKDQLPPNTIAEILLDYSSAQVAPVKWLWRKSAKGICVDIGVKSYEMSSDEFKKLEQLF